MKLPREVIWGNPAQRLKGVRDRQSSVFSGCPAWSCDRRPNNVHARRAPRCLLHICRVSAMSAMDTCHWVVLQPRLEHPSLHKFLPLAQTYCKTRGRHQNMVNVHFFLLRAFFPKPGWSVLQDDRSLNIQKERAEIKMQNERKYPQNERKYPQTSANLKSVTIPPSSGWKKGMWSSVFSGGERFLGGRAEIGNSSVFFSYLKKRARWVPQALRQNKNEWYGWPPLKIHDPFVWYG